MIAVRDNRTNSMSGNHSTEVSKFRLLPHVGSWKETDEATTRGLCACGRCRKHLIPFDLLYAFYMYTLMISDPPPPSPQHEMKYPRTVKVLLPLLY